jgi:hypothetical protein
MNLEPGATKGMVREELVRNAEDGNTAAPGVHPGTAQSVGYFEVRLRVQFTYFSGSGASCHAVLSSMLRFFRPRDAAGNSHHENCVDSLEVLKEKRGAGGGLIIAHSSEHERDSVGSAALRRNFAKPVFASGTLAGHTILNRSIKHEFHRRKFLRKRGNLTHAHLS